MQVSQAVHRVDLCEVQAVEEFVTVDSNRHGPCDGAWLVAPWKLEDEPTRRSPDKVAAISVPTSSTSYSLDFPVNRSVCTVQCTLDLDVPAP